MLIETITAITLYCTALNAHLANGDNKSCVLTASIRFDIRFWKKYDSLQQQAKDAVRTNIDYRRAFEANVLREILPDITPNG